MKTHRSHDGEWKLLLIVGLGTACILYTGIHSVIYNWVFLRRFVESEELPGVISPALIVAYWNWMPGRVLLLGNVAIIVGLFALLHFAFRERNEELRDSSDRDRNRNS